MNSLTLTLSNGEGNKAISARLEELYRVLSSYEKRELTRFLRSPYFNRDQNLVKLHQYFSDTELIPDKFIAWKAISKSSYNEKKFRYLVSDLLSAIEEFVFIKSFLKSKKGFTHSLDEYFSSREAWANKSHLAKEIKGRKTSRRITLSPEYHLEEHYESELQEELHMTSFKQLSRYLKENKKSEPDGLDLFYVIEKLRQACLLANNNNVFGFNLKAFYQDEILKLASSKQFIGNPFVIAYQSVFLMLTTKEERYYYKLKEVIDKYGYEMEDKNLAELFTYARNFCIGKINVGNEKYFHEVFDLYEQGLSKRVLLLNGEINQQNYKNIVTTGLRIGKHQWVFDFINDYRYKLNKKVRENSYNYNFANYLFHIGKFDKALQNLQKVSLADLFYGLDARSLMIKCYYELEEYEAFFNSYQSFRVFVMRKKNVSEQHRRNYKNFLRIAKKLINLRPRDKKNILKIHEEIKTQKALADKRWLEEKINLFVD